MRSHRRRGPLEHVLIAGSDDELSAIEALLHLLPPTTYGQVLVETARSDALPSLSVPPRIGVSRLELGAADAPGDRLADAVTGWLAEWMPEDPDPHRAVTVWVGRSARDRVDVVGTTLESL